MPGETLEEVQDAILDRLHAGETVDRDAVLSAHPQHTDALREFFRVLDVIEDQPAAGAAEPASLGEFRIVREIGRGGMGVVYEAEQASLSRRVALKVLPPALRTDPRLVLRFRREAEAAGKLRHPGIVPVYSVGEVAGTPFFAMELVEGRSIDAILRDLKDGKDGGVPAAGEPRRRWALEVCAKVADALAYAHSRGILHRDVKPANVLIDRDGAPRLTDFGLALDVRAPGLTLAGEVFGSLHYMSPEQALRRESPVDARTDVYSLAVTLYEMLTLRLPYDGDTSAELITALTTGRIVPPRSADPSIPPAVEEVLLRALRRDPLERYASAGALASDLRTLVAGGAVRAAAAPVFAPAAETPRRRWSPRVVVAGIAALLVVAACVAVIVSIGLWRASGDRPRRDAYTTDDLRLLAAGTPGPDTPPLSSVMQCSVRVRPVLSRKDLGNYRCSVTWNHVGIGTTTSPLAVVAHWQAAVDGGPWIDLGTTFTRIDAPAESRSGDRGAQDRITSSCTPPLAVLLGTAPAPSATLRHRAEVGVAIIPADWNGVDTSALRPAVRWTWTDEPKTCVIYDDYPADYPERVAGPGVDAAMRRAATPSSATYTGVSRTPAGTRTVDLLATWNSGEGPVDSAFDVDLFAPGLEGVVGTAQVSWSACTYPLSTVTRHAPLAFALAPSAKEEDIARLLLRLDSGDEQKLRLVFRPSRTVALANPEFSRYWGGTVDVTLPVRKGSGIIETSK